MPIAAPATSAPVAATHAIRARGLSTSIVRTLQAGGPDAYGKPAEHGISDGAGNPCRHCLTEIPAGRGMLILAHRPFPEPQPYAETGPIFLCADACAAWTGDGLPPILATSPCYMLRGYGADHRIVYGTGSVVAAARLAGAADAILARPGVGYVHVRSAANGCFQCRLERG
ncbi:MAG: DUF1203 domain-containing protein [Pikeienuella sp.]